MPRSRTEGWGHFKAEELLLSGLPDGACVYGCWVHGGNKLLLGVLFTISAGVPSAQASCLLLEVRAVSFVTEPQGLNGQCLSRNPQHRREKNRTLPRQSGFR